MRRRTHKASPVQLELTGTRTGIEAPSALSRWSTSRDAKAETPAPKPWLAVVLAVDTARMSGWSIALRGKYMCSGELDTLDEAIVEQVVSNACALSTEHRVPVVMVLEAPWGGSPNIVAMLGAARERWLRAWRCAEQASARVVYVQPNQWRGVVLGRKWASAPRDAVRAHEQVIARWWAKLRIVGADEAPAILIGRWASQARPVGRSIGKRAMRASVRAWTEGGSV